MKSYQTLLADFLQAPQPLLLLELESESKTLREEIAAGFEDAGRRAIPCEYLYDQRGALLYEEITLTQEYYPARTETKILQQIAPTLRERLGRAPLIELGSGSSQKTRALLNAWRAHQEETLYVPIDVSRAMLARSAASLVADYKSLQVLGLIGRYEDAFSALPPMKGSLVCFLGGTIGNFTPEAQSLFIKRMSQRMSPGEHLLLGFSRSPHAKKPAQTIIDAYNDAAGLTSQFNLNLLARINRELGANFDLSQFAHVALYNEAKSQVEIYIESLSSQTISIKALGRDYRFSKGERIFTEISRRYDPASLQSWFEARGFTCRELFGDAQGLFGLLLLQYKGGTQ